MEIASLFFITRCHRYTAICNI